MSRPGARFHVRSKPNVPGLLLVLAMMGGTSGVGRAQASEFRICSDVSSQGAGQPCEQSTCIAEDGSTVAGMVGESCAATSTNGDLATASISYAFNTSSPSGTPFSLWLRLVADASWEDNEAYVCNLSGVTGLGLYPFAIFETELIDSPHLNPGCNGVGEVERACWGRDSALASIALDAGPHVLMCSISVTSLEGGIEAAGFDGLIFTTDTGYVPDEQDTACDDDALFEAGTCYGNWGPNVLPSAVPVLGIGGALLLAALVGATGGRALVRRQAEKGDDGAC